MSNNESDILNRTRPAIGDDLITALQENKFCIVGCGGTGALFAEMLVRTGAKNITLIDGDVVESSNLNRVIGFTKKDIDCKKVDVLASRFKEISPDVEITTISHHLRKYDKSDKDAQIARNAVCNSHISIIAVDKNCIRIECEKLVRESRGKDKKREYIGIGVVVNENGHFEFECAWNRNTPIDKKEEEGYGAGSFISIVVEATSVAFSMLLHNLKHPESDRFRYYYKEYKDFIPIKVTANSNKLLD